MSQPFTVTSLGPIGARIDGLDLRQPIDDATARTLLDAWHEHLILVVTRQPINDHQLADFARRFGQLEQSPIPDILKGNAYVPDTPEITVVSNVVVDGVPIGGLGDAEATWHSDMSYLDTPPPGCMLHARVLPPEGGDTWFANMYLAFDDLPAALRQRVEGLVINHDSSTTSTGATRRGFDPVTDVREAPGARHPAVLEHPGSGLKALYLGRRHNAWVVDMPVDESDALLDEIWQYCARPEHTYRHVWSDGDLVMWDNRCTMHRRDGWTPGAPRTLHRAQLKTMQV